MRLHTYPSWRKLATVTTACAAVLIVAGSAKPAQAHSVGVGVQVRIGDFRIGARYDDRDYRGGYRYPNAYPCPDRYPIAVPYPGAYPYPAPYPEPYPSAYPYPAPAPYPYPAPYAYPVPVPYPEPYPYVVGGGYRRDRDDCDDWRYRRR